MHTNKRKWLIGCILLCILVVSMSVPSFANHTASGKKLRVEQLSEVTLETKGSLNEVLEKLPTSVTGDTESGNQVNIPVTWVCEGDYETTNYYYYLFKASWDKETYDIAEEPYIWVKIKPDFMVPRAVTSSGNETIIFDYLVDELDCNTATALGILANLERESAFRPTAECIDTNGLTSYGICQWNGVRFESLKNYCEEYDYDYSTIEAQLEFLKYELYSTEKRAWSMMQDIPNTQEGAYTAGYNWARYFERCASVYHEVSAKRARDVYWVDYVGEEEQIIELNAPTFSIGNNSSTGKIVLTWNAIKGAEKYEIYRKIGKNGTFKKFLTTSKTKWTNTAAVAGKVYYYKIRAKAGDNYSEFSKVKYRTCDLAQPNLSISLNGKEKPILKWNAIEGASKYEVYRSTNKTGTYTKLTTIKGTKFTNTSAVSGKTYYYKVKAICDSNNAGNSVFSAVKSITCKMKLDTPVIVAGNNVSSGKVTLKWNPITNAEKYEVYRAISKNGTYKKMYTTTGTQYTNTSAVAGRNYYYKVRAVSGNVKSEFSAVKNRTCDLARPNVTISLNGSGKPRLTWEPIEGATRYEVYRATSKDGTYKQVYSTTDTMMNNTSALSKKTYYYKVRAIHSNTSAYSAYSVIDEITTR